MKRTSGRYRFTWTILRGASSEDGIGFTYASLWQCVLGIALTTVCNHMDQEVSIRIDTMSLIVITSLNVYSLEECEFDSVSLSSIKLQTDPILPYICFMLQKGSPASLQGVLAKSSQKSINVSSAEGSQRSDHCGTQPPRRPCQSQRLHH